jgi:hypothetical protein
MTQESETTTRKELIPTTLEHFQWYQSLGAKIEIYHTTTQTTLLVDLKISDKASSTEIQPNFKVKIN